MTFEFIFEKYVASGCGSVHYFMVEVLVMNLVSVFGIFLWLSYFDSSFDILVYEIEY